MNDDTIRMAREACDTDKVDAWHNGFWTLTQEELERFAALVRADERERIAAEWDGCMYGDLEDVDIGAAIRARNQPTQADALNDENPSFG